MCNAQTKIVMNKEYGIYTIPCEVNGLKLKFIFDTGASNVTISLTEAIFMIKNGYLSKSDIYGSSYAQLANGQITENTQILLREIKIKDLKLQNVKASIVHELEAPLLLGQTAISKLGTYQVDSNILTIYGNEAPITRKKIGGNDDIEKIDIITLNGQKIVVKTKNGNKMFFDKFGNEIFFLTHTVKKKETLYGLSKLYNVSISDIKNSNPNLKWRRGEEIKIPLK